MQDSPHNHAPYLDPILSPSPILTTSEHQFIHSSYLTFITSPITFHNPGNIPTRIPNLFKKEPKHHHYAQHKFHVTHMISITSYKTTIKEKKPWELPLGSTPLSLISKGTELARYYRKCKPHSSHHMETWKLLVYSKTLSSGASHRPSSYSRLPGN